MNGAVVTGANGFIGSAVVKELLHNGVDVCAVVHNGHVDNLPPESDKMSIVSCDSNEIVNLKDVISKKYEVFYDMAWDGSAGPKRADVSLQLKNVNNVVDALCVAKAIGCKRFLHSGSIVETETMAAAYSDGCKPGMGAVYGCGKVAAHIMSMAVAAKEGIDILWPMITNAYGVGERSPRLINSTIRKCIVGEEPEFTAATQNYDFVYIDDIARAFYLIGEKGKPFKKYLIGSSNAKPLKEFLLEMRDSIAPELEFHFGSIPFTGVELPLSDFDCSVTERDTGFKAKVSFADGCRRTRDWIINERDTYAKI